jgi:hypothetical protein
MFDKRDKASLWIAAVLAGVSCLAFSLVLEFHNLSIRHKVVAAQKWIPTPCHVEARGVRLVWHSRRSSSYDGYANYSYDFGGHHYQGWVFDFVDGHTASDTPGRNALYGLPTDREATCFVNPANPDEAVIYRGLPQDVADDKVLIAVAVFGVILMCAGVAASPRKLIHSAIEPHEARRNLRGARLKDDVDSHTIQHNPRRQE